MQKGEKINCEYSTMNEEVILRSGPIAYSKEKLKIKQELQYP
jgi:hypothetical protein